MSAQNQNTKYANEINLDEHHLLPGCKKGVFQLSTPPISAFHTAPSTCTSLKSCQHSWDSSNLYKLLLLHTPQTSNNSYFLSQGKQSDIPCNYSLQFLILTGQFLSFFHRDYSFRGLLPGDDQYPLNHTVLALNINDDKDFWLFTLTDLHC